MYLHNKTVFLAGSTGMIGSAIIKHILSEYPSTKIRAVFYRNPKPCVNDERVEYVRADLRNKNDCMGAAKGCDCAIMAAANTTGSKATAFKSWEQVNDNVIMNVNMLEAFNLLNLRRVVYIGSATLYQEFEGDISEDKLDLDVEPHPSYFGLGWGFRFVEKLCEFWHRQSDRDVIIVRASNIFGPYAKFNPQVSNFIPAIIRKAVDKMDPFEIWGSPDIARDVIYSEDFARAIVMLLDNDNIKFDVFNLGSGTKTTVGQVAGLALKYAGHKPSDIKYVSTGPVTISSRGLDCSKVQERLKWKPLHTIEEGIEKTTKWWTENKGWWEK